MPWFSENASIRDIKNAAFKFYGINSYYLSRMKGYYSVSDLGKTALRADYMSFIEKTVYVPCDVEFGTIFDSPSKAVYKKIIESSTDYVGRNVNNIIHQMYGDVDEKNYKRNITKLMLQLFTILSPKTSEKKEESTIKGEKVIEEETNE